LKEDCGLPQPDASWLRQDTLLLLTVPISLVLVFRQSLPFLLPLFVLPIYIPGFWILRRMQRSPQLENGVLLILGSFVWIILVDIFVITPCGEYWDTPWIPSWGSHGSACYQGKV